MRSPFEYLAHLVTTTVSVGGIESTFVVDSGIGVTIVSTELAGRAGIESNGATYTGKRMSGQEVTVELAHLDAIALGDHVQVERDGPATTVFLPLTLPGGREALVEVDMGSDVLILDERFGDGLEQGEVVEGVDETGNPYSRRFTSLVGRVHAAQDEAIGQDDPRVQIQRIIHDGLVGDDFLRRHTVTFDPRLERMIFSG